MLPTVIRRNCYEKKSSLLLILVMLFTCAFSALAETAEATDELKAAEMEKGIRLPVRI